MDRSRAWYLGRKVIFLGRYRATSARIRYPESSVVHIVPLEHVVVSGRRLRASHGTARDAA